MQCPRCQKENNEGARFCRQCGAPLEALRACPQCGHPNPSDSNFCEECGCSLTPATVPPPVAPLPIQPPSIPTPPARKEAPKSSPRRPGLRPQVEGLPRLPWVKVRQAALALGLLVAVLGALGPSLESGPPATIGSSMRVLFAGQSAPDVGDLRRASVGPDGSLAVTTAKGRLLWFAPSGELTGQVSLAKGSDPRGVALDARGVAHVVDVGRGFVVSVTPSGQMSDEVDLKAIGAHEPNALAFTSRGEALMADTGRGRLLALDLSTGKPLRELGVGQLKQPVEFASTPDGSLYVLDIELKKIVVFGPDGALRRSFASAGASAVASDQWGRLYLASSEREGIEVWAPQGRPLQGLALNEAGRPQDLTTLGGDDVLVVGSSAMVRSGLINAGGPTKELTFSTNLLVLALGLAAVATALLGGSVSRRGPKNAGVASELAPRKSKATAPSAASAFRPTEPTSEPRAPGPELAVAGQAGLTLGLPPVLGASLLLLAVAAAFVYTARAADGRRPEPGRLRAMEWGGLAALTGIAFAVRFWSNEAYPPWSALR